MPRFEAVTDIGADLDTTVAFHSDVRGLVELTPGILQPHVRLRDGDSTTIAVGFEFEITLTPFGLLRLPPFHARVTAMRHDGERTVIEDELVEGPFDRWYHRHVFDDIPGGTRIYDDIRYRGPAGGTLGSLTAPLVLDGLFQYRRNRLIHRFGRPSR